MKWEDSQLRVILSSRIGLLKREQRCIVCSMPLYIGEKHRSFSIVDRLKSTMERWYTCEEHSAIFNYSSVEDCEEYHQQYLLDNRLTNEVWFKE